MNRRMFVVGLVAGVISITQEVEAQEEEEPPSMAINRTFKRLIEENGMTIEQGGKHYAIMCKGRRVGTLSGTGEANAYRQSVRDLARQKLLKNEKQARQLKFS